MSYGLTQRFIILAIACIFPLFLFSQTRQYETFQQGDTADFHIVPGMVISSGGSNFCSVGMRADTLNPDTIYNAFKHLVALNRERDTMAPVLISHDSIYQGGEKIGYFQSGFPVPAGEIQIRLPSGILIARLTASDDKVYRVQTLYDLKNHIVGRIGFYEQDIAMFLVRNGYL